MRYFPINLNIQGKKCLVVGGGRIAERRVLSLLECGADVTIVSPRVTPMLEKLLDKKRVKYKAKTYKPGDIKGAYIVIASTNDQDLNRQIGGQAKRVGALVNIVSNSSLSDFTVPGQLRRGNLLVTISTSGTSPALSKILKAKLESILGKEYEIFTNLLEAIRRKFLCFPTRKRQHIYSQVAMSKIPELLREKKYKHAERELRKITGLGFNDLLS
jgi:precorrin-2 dehydrogenase/sirohydrochlorin ferrochelatase